MNLLCYSRVFIIIFGVITNTQQVDAHDDTI